MTIVGRFNVTVVHSMRKGIFQDKLLVVDILSKAFDTNRSVNYVVRQDQNRQKRIRRLMSYSFNVCRAFGEVWISDDDQACALILHPDKKKTSLGSILWDIKLAFVSNWIRSCWKSFEKRDSN